jgi:CubicO group peptidase (beta-lactamase class C family)
MQDIIKGTLPDRNYLNRYIQYGCKNRFRQTIDDFKFFPHSVLSSSENIFRFKEDDTFKKPDLINMNVRGINKTFSLNELMISSKTTAFLVIRDDTILYENYFNGYQRDTISRFMSITKSFTSALIGIAIGEGLIRDVNDKIVNYIPELKNHKCNEITIKNLLMMDSGIEYKEGAFPWTDDVKQYWTSDIRTMIKSLRVKDDIGAFFHYNDYHLHLMAVILERTSGMRVSEYFDKKIYQCIGPEFPAYIVLDSSKNCFERMESGLCASAIDLAKFGRLYLNNGRWEGRQIVPENWVKDSIGRSGANDSIEFFKYYNDRPWGKWLGSGKAFYKNLWWGYKVDDELNDSFAMGVLGQILYICPRKNSIVVRLGKEWGIPSWWPTLMKDLIEQISIND